MEQKKIELSQLLEVILKFKKDPSEANDKALKDMINSFEIQTYMPLYNKKIVAAIIINTVLVLNQNPDALETSAILTMNKTIYGLLSYVTNLHNDLVTFASVDLCYDALCEFDVIDSILKYCEKDYKRLEKLIDDSMNFVHIDRIVELGNSLNPENLKLFTDTMKEMKRELTPELLKDIKSILNAESPEWKAFKETVADKAMDSTINNPAEKILKESTNDKDTKNKN